MTIDDLDPELLAEVRSIKADAIGAREQLGRIESSRRQDRRVLNRIQFLVLAKFATLILLLCIVFNLNDTTHNTQQTNDVIKDCTTPSGLCAQRGATSQILYSIRSVYLSDYVNQTSALQVSSSIGNEEAAKIRQDQIALDIKVLNQIDENLIDVANNRPQRNVLPTVPRG